MTVTQWKADPNSRPTARTRAYTAAGQVIGIAWQPLAGGDWEAEIVWPARQPCGTWATEAQAKAALVTAAAKISA